jgi:hypothetical protein
MSTEMLSTLKGAFNGILEWERATDAINTATAHLKEATAEVVSIEEAETTYRESRNMNDQELPYQKRSLVSPALNAARAQVKAVRESIMIAEKAAQDAKTSVRASIDKIETLVHIAEKN